MTKKLGMGVVVSVTLAVGVAAQERFEVLPLEQGRVQGVGKYKVERQSNPDDYNVEVVDKDNVLLGRITFQERVNGVSSATWENTATGVQLTVKYSPGYTNVEISDGTETATSEAMIESKQFKRTPAFDTLQKKHKKDFDMLLEAITTVSTEDERKLEENKAKKGASSGYLSATFCLVSQKGVTYSCNGRTCRGSAYSVTTKSLCCAMAKQKTNNCCGIGLFCVGCCYVGSCNAYCQMGDYFCVVCDTTGRACSPI